jgi:hypothetical protein
VDSQVKVRGFRIELGEDSPGDKRLVGYVVAREGQGLLSNSQSDDSTKKVSSK